MKINRERIIRDYSKLKSLISSEIEAEHWDKACSYMQRASSFMYNCNVVYSDQQLEDSIGIIARKCTNTSVPYNRNQDILAETIRNRRVVFYDYFAWDNRGLTEQYIDSFSRLGLRVLYVFRNKESEACREIFKKIRANNAFTVHVTNALHGEELIRELFDIITGYGPTDLIAHTSPWDVEGLCACRALEGLCTRYLSNITDHAYWLGTSAFDYFLEFRDYGCNISQTYRGIPPEKDIKMPYFPIINNEVKFEGFPFDVGNRKIIVSGGSIYKIKGSDKFFEIVKHVLDNHPDTLFLYIGNGDHQYLQNFSDKNGYGGRFFHITERKDIYQVICHSTLYLNTYPMLGGLMTQISAMAGKVPMTLNDSDDPCQAISELLTISDNIPQIEFHDVKSLLCAIDNYLNHPEVLRRTEEDLRQCVPTPEAFAKMLNDVLVKHSTGLNPAIYPVDIDQFAKRYIWQLNEKPRRYRSFFYSSDIRMAVRFIPYYTYRLLNKLGGGRS